MFLFSLYCFRSIKPQLYSWFSDASIATLQILVDLQLVSAILHALDMANCAAQRSWCDVIK